MLSVLVVAQCSLSLLWFSYPVNHAHVLLGATEVFGQVGDAERLVLTRVNPHLVLWCPGDPVEEDPERLPHSLLTNWPNKHTQRQQLLRLSAVNTLLPGAPLHSNNLFHSLNYNKWACHRFPVFQHCISHRSNWQKWLFVSRISL